MTSPEPPPHDDGDFIAIDWGSTSFRAYRVARDGSLVDTISSASGILSLDRPAMERLVTDVATRWPGVRRWYAAGMIGANIGWAEAPYVRCPVGGTGLADHLMPVTIGDVAIRIVPGLSCRHVADAMPDVLRGEEVEIFGALDKISVTTGCAVLPGTHSKWLRFADGRVCEFMTSLSGELYDHLTRSGILSSIIAGEARDGVAFRTAVAVGHARRRGLSTLLFGVRAQVLNGDIDRADAASHARGLLIGADIADAQAMFPTLGDSPIAVIGNAGLSVLHAAALDALGMTAAVIDARQSAIDGFRRIDREKAI